MKIPSWLSKPETLVTLGSLGAAFFLVGGGNLVKTTVKDIATRGNKLTNGTYISSLGIVTQEPATLLQEAIANLGGPISLDEYSLARMIRSEGIGQGLLRAHVALNDLASLSWPKDLTDLVTYSTDASRRHLYGSQWSAAVPPSYPHANARRYSTSKDPYEGDVAIASQAIAERSEGIDRAAGAVKFLDKSSMGIQVGSSSFENTDAAWQADGLTPFTLPEWGDDLVLYKKA